jgi:hypothetical protein
VKLLDWARPPAAGAGLVETLRWSVRMETAFGVVVLAAGLALWNAGWWHWLLIALGAVAVSPLAGTRIALRMAKRQGR